MVDLIDETLKAMCGRCDDSYPYPPNCIGKCFEYEETEENIEDGIKEWLSSFDTSSATKCFEAVNILKQRLEGEVDE